MHHPPSCDHPHPMLHSPHTSSSPSRHSNISSGSCSLTAPWVRSSTEAWPSCSPTNPPWWSYLMPFPLDGVVICVLLFKETKAINETCQRLAALKPHSLCQIKIIDHWLQKAQWRQMDRYSHPINFSSSGNQAKNSWSQHLAMNWTQISINTNWNVKMCWLLNIIFLKMVSQRVKTLTIFICSNRRTLIYLQGPWWE